MFEMAIRRIIKMLFRSFSFCFSIVTICRKSVKIGGDINMKADTSVVFQEIPLEGSVCVMTKINHHKP